jgi:Ca2+-binding EF-hand superfamily protein
MAEYVGKKTAAEDEAEFKKFDKDSDGSLTLEEFLEGMSKGKKKKNK